MEKKTKSRIIFWSVSLGLIIISVVVIMVVGMVIVSQTNDKAMNVVLSQPAKVSQTRATTNTSSINSANTSTEEIINDEISEPIDVEENGREIPNEQTAIDIYEDEYVKISYIGFGKGASYPFENRQCLILMVENKTDTVFDILPRSISLDGIDVGKLSCYESVSAHSKGKIYLLKMKDTDNEFENTTPSRITGAIAIKDLLDIGIWGEDEWWYIVSFVDVDL